MADDDYDDTGSAEWFARKMEREQYEKFHRNEKGKDWHYDNGFDKQPEISPTVVDARTWGGKPRPVREFLDGRRWFRMGMVSNFSGPGAIGKTLISLQACVSMASGTTWLNHPIRPGPVMFFSAEERLDEIQIRIDEICEAENLFLQDFPHPIEVVDVAHQQMAALIEAASGKNGKMLLQLTNLYHWLDSRMAKLKPVALFVDNRAQVIIGNENDRAVAGFSMRMLAALAHKHGCSIIILSHPSLSGNKTGASGSTQWFNTARSNVFMKRPGDEHRADEEDDLAGDDGRRELVNNKANYGPGDTTASVKWEFNRWVCTDPAPRPDSSIGKADKGERVFMQRLVEYMATNRPICLVKGSPYFAPTVLAGEYSKGQLEGLGRGDLIKAMRSLIAQNKIKSVNVGTARRAVWTVEICNP